MALGALHAKSPPSVRIFSGQTKNVLHISRTYVTLPELGPFSRHKRLDSPRALNALGEQKEKELKAKKELRKKQEPSGALFLRS